jgi:hypothetical protein
MLIERFSPFTGERRVRDLPITQEQLDDWLSGTLIQKAFPHLSASEREFILSGITDDEWDELFVEEDSTDEDEDAF